MLPGLSELASGVQGRMLSNLQSQEHKLHQILTNYQQLNEILYQVI